MPLNHYPDDSTLSEVIEKCEQGEAVTIVCAGDSITAGGSSDRLNPTTISYPDHLQTLLQQYYNNENITVINSGIGAATTTEIVNEWGSGVASYNPDLIIFMGGTNDAYPSKKIVFSKVSLTGYKRNLKKAIGLAGETPLVFLGITPRRKAKLFKTANFSVHAYRLACRKTAIKNDIRYIDLYRLLLEIYENGDLIREEVSPDGCHYRNEGYMAIAEIVFSDVFLGMDMNDFELGYLAE